MNTTSSPRPTRRVRLTIALAGVAAASALTLVLAGCSGSGSSGGTPSSSSSPSSQGQGGGQNGDGQNGDGQNGGGASGLIAAIQGSTLQVQDAAAGTQTAVTYSSSTTIEKNAKVTLSAVTVGSCITASSLPTNGTGSSSGSTDAASGSGAVTTVAITQPTNGDCTGGFGGAGGTRPSGGTFTPRPQSSGRPSGVPSGLPTARLGGFSIPTSGKVTAVSGSTITVDALDFQTQKTTSKKVTVDASTTYTEAQKTTASALKVNECVTARGQADSSGTVAATALTLSDPAADGSCTTGFGGRGFGGGFRNGTGAGTGSGTTGSGSND